MFAAIGVILILFAGCILVWDSWVCTASTRKQNKGRERMMITMFYAGILSVVFSILMS
jgi:predicted nucleic acid-binding Zn ribbon protein